MAGLLAAVYQGSDSGHGRCIPMTIHAVVPCGTPCIGAPKKSVVALDASIIWPPFTQTPLNVIQTVFNVVINGQIPIVDQDSLVPHPGGPCTNLIKFSGCDPVPSALPCTAAEISAEDVAGGGAHPRTAKATTKSVFINGRRACRVGDPLGPPCLSLIATGAPTVFIGV